MYVCFAYIMCFAHVHITNMFAFHHVHITNMFAFHHVHITNMFAFHQAIELDANNAKAYFRRGCAWLSLNEPDRAEVRPICVCVCVCVCVCTPEGDAHG
jgi:hypothetical protein